MRRRENAFFLLHESVALLHGRAAQQVGIIIMYAAYNDQSLNF
jgi:hypothetical protein